MTRADIELLLQELAATRQHLEETGRILRALIDRLGAHLTATDPPAPPTDPDESDEDWANRQW